MERAQCRGEDRNLFFPSLGMETVKARAICAVCPVTVECLDYALANMDTTGIWSGTTAQQRKAMRTGRVA
jgi:WhiB family redox-sensing transcriptional regulator